MDGLCSLAQDAIAQARQAIEANGQQAKSPFLTSEGIMPFSSVPLLCLRRHLPIFRHDTRTFDPHRITRHIPTRHGSSHEPDHALSASTYTRMKQQDFLIHVYLSRFHRICLTQGPFGSHGRTEEFCMAFRVLTFGGSLFFSACRGCIGDVHTLGGAFRP